jgi:hypothetical protein
LLQYRILIDAAPNALPNVLQEQVREILKIRLSVEVRAHVFLSVSSHRVQRPQ